jgi:CrcB protein
MLKNIMLIAFSGAFGALCRYAMVNAIGGRFFPWGTMAVNVLGSLLMGLAFVYIVERAVFPPELKPVVMTGFLGAFTTYSAFSLEAWQLFDRGELFSALAYIIGTTLFCLIALLAGVFIARLTL